MKNKSALYTWRLLLLLCLWIGWGMDMKAQLGDEVESFTLPEGVDSSVVHLEANPLSFPAGHALFVDVFDRLLRMMQGETDSLRVLHIGGSHVKGGYFSGRMRSNMQDAFAGETLLPTADGEVHPSLCYDELGVNGATVPFWLRNEALTSYLDTITPDLVIMGIGINDANVLDFNPELFKANYRELVSRFQARNPQCALIFIVNNDCWWRIRGKRVRTRKGRRTVYTYPVNPHTERVEVAMMELAREYQGAVWNQYRVMGGKGSSSAWVEAGLMQADHIHFTARGYHLLGDLLYNAMLEAF